MLNDQCSIKKGKFIRFLFASAKKESLCFGGFQNRWVAGYSSESPSSELALACASLPGLPITL